MFDNSKEFKRVGLDVSIAVINLNKFTFRVIYRTVQNDYDESVELWFYVFFSFLT